MLKSNLVLAWQPLIVPALWQHSTSHNSVHQVPVQLLEQCSGFLPQYLDGIQLAEEALSNRVRNSTGGVPTWTTAGKHISI